MVPSQSDDLTQSDVAAGLAGEHADALLDIAEVSIRAGVDGARYPGPDPTRLPDALRQPCRSFVTIHVDGVLHGCIGNLAGTEPVGACISYLAHQAAFEDPRFPPLRRPELDRLQLEISLLTEPSPVPARTRDELLDHLRFGVDGLVIAADGRRAVFLPAVWAQLPDPDDFLDHLLRKAGLPPNPWPDDLLAEVFVAHEFARELF